MKYRFEMNTIWENMREAGIRFIRIIHGQPIKH